MEDNCLYMFIWSFENTWNLRNKEARPTEGEEETKFPSRK